MGREFGMGRGALAVVTAVGLAAGAARGESAAKPGAGPAIHGSVVAPPAWLPPGAPFDVAKHLAPPPAASNAAPLYLEAFREFLPLSGVDFPGGPLSDAAVQAVRGRRNRIQSLYDAHAKGGAPAAAVDALVDECGPGLKKLAEAQKRDRCNFSPALGPVALEIAPDAFGVVHVLALKANRDLGRGRPDSAVADLAAVLRLSRDLRRRGSTIAQILAGRMESVAAREIAAPILAVRGLKPGVYDELIKTFKMHEAAAVDPWTETVQEETLTILATARALSADFQTLRSELGVDSNMRPGDVLAKLAGSDVAASDVAAMNARFEGWRPADDQALVAILYPWCKARLDPSARSYSARLRLAKAPIDRGADGDPALKAFLAESALPLEGALKASTRSAAEVRAVACLTALRRWRATKNGAPASLEAAVKAAGMSATPLDPFNDRPMRMANLGGAVVVYSVGEDLKDDGGRVISARLGQPGDIVFALDAPARR